MAMFNLKDYETVEERIKRFYADNPSGRIITENLTTETDRAVSTWVVKATVYLDLIDDLPKATGHAFEIDGGGGANKTSALENAETSAIGRALANAGYSGNKRASREEMQKVARARDWVAEANGLTVDGLRLLYSEAVAAQVAPTVLEALKELGRGSKDSESKSD